jgi:hypothetical protein
MLHLDQSSPSDLLGDFCRDFVIKSSGFLKKVP